MTTPTPARPEEPATGAPPSVREVMHTGVIEVPAQATIGEIAARMTERHIHCVVVSGLAAGPDSLAEVGWGIVSDIDLMRAIATEREGASAGTIAATDAPVIGPDESVIRAAQLMAEHETAHLLVAADGDDYPLGIVSTLDVAAAVATGSAGA